MSEDTRKELHLLAVDDDAAIVRVLGLVYGAEYHLDTATTVQAARTLLLRSRYDAVILDIHLPDGLGTDLLRTIRTDPSFASCRNVPVVMLTSSIDGNIYEEAWDLGSVAYVKKPFEVEELSSAIQQATQDPRT